MDQPLGNPDRAIVVVDDDEAVRDSLVAMLRADGFAARASRFGPRLLQRLDDASAVCVVIDFDVLGDAASEIIAALQQHDPPISAILMTGRHDRRMQKRMMTLGVAAIVEKPIRSDALVKAVRDACGGGPAPGA